MNKHDMIDDWIFRSYQKELTGRERELLETWIKASPENEAYFREMTGELFRAGAAGEWQGLDSTKSCLWTGVNREILYRGKRKFVRLGRIAAVIIILLTSGAIAYHQRRQTSQVERVTGAVPEVPRAILTLGGGERVFLGNGQHGTILRGKQVTIREDTTGTLHYEGGSTKEDLVLEENEIHVPTGGEYHLVLSDGTRVWLNSESRMKFPACFHGNARTIFLQGEAYLEVARDENAPFIVTTTDTRVQVLGTSFNVKAYEDEACVFTTLFSGEVSVTPVLDSTRRVLLSPGEQACWDSSTRQLSRREVSLDRVIAWKGGVFTFDKENIKEVTRQIERWYGVKFIYSVDKLERYTFNGYFSKNDTLERILESLSFMSDLRFEIKSTTVHVTSK